MKKPLNHSQADGFLKTIIEARLGSLEQQAANLRANNDRITKNPEDTDQPSGEVATRTSGFKKTIPPVTVKPDWVARAKRTNGAELEK